RRRGPRPQHGADDARAAAREGLPAPPPAAGRLSLRGGATLRRAAARARALVRRGHARRLAVAVRRLPGRGGRRQPRRARRAGAARRAAGGEEGNVMSGVEVLGAIASRLVATSVIGGLL